MNWSLLIFLIIHQGPVSVGYSEHPESGKAIPFVFGVSVVYNPSLCVH